GFMFVGTNNSLDNTEENLTIYHFESAALASSSYFALTDTDEYEEFHISLLDNIIIIEKEIGTYKTFRNSHTPTNSISTKVTSFIKDSILSECTPQKGVFAYVGFRQQSFFNFGLISNSNNITISYSINSEKIEYPVIDIKDYTDDSYRNKFDDGYYFSYLKKVTDEKTNSDEKTN
nr:hypothetical protein [Clostridia bacterium]